MTVHTIDPAGAPTGQDLNVSVRKRIEKLGQVVEREVSTNKLTTDPKTGQATLSLKIDDADGGPFVIALSGTDRFGNPIVAEHPLTLSGKRDQTHLRILADRQDYKVGESARVNLHSRGASGTALVAWQADGILTYRLIPLKEGDNELTWNVDAAQAPNFTLSASRMTDNRLDEARLDVAATRDLHVTLTPKKPSVNPGELVEVEVRTTDSLGRPVPAELSLALVDKALLRLHGDPLPNIEAFFHNRQRTGAFATTSTNTFRYQPTTVPVPEAIVEDAQRTAALALNAAKLGDVRQEAQNQVVLEKATTLINPVRDHAFAMGGAMGGGGQTNASGENPRSYADLPGIVVGGFEPTDKQAPFRTHGGLGPDEPARQKDKVLGRRPARSRPGDQTQSTEDDFDAADEARFEVGLAFDMPVGGDKASRGGGRQAQYSARQRVVETAYWNPSIVTDAQGLAKVALRAPEALSRYEFTARGITAADTLAGQTRADLEVRKDFSIDLKAPTALNEGDKPRFIARLAHRGINAPAKVRLTLGAGGRDLVQPRDVTWKGDGVEEILFDPYEVPIADALKLTATAEAGDSTDAITLELPIRPWGVPVVASASGTSSSSTTINVALPPGRPYEKPELIIDLAPTPQRLLVELALGQHNLRPFQACILPPPRTTADRASDLLATASVLLYLRDIGASDEGDRLASRVRDLVAELTAAQRPDGGWSWVSSSTNQLPGDRATTALVLWALRGPWKLGGMVTESQTIDKAIAFLQNEYGKLDAADTDTRAAILHALATWEKATFEQANALGRDRQNLSDSALAHLAQTFVALGRPTLAVETLGVLTPRAKHEAAGPGLPDRLSWTSNRQGPAEVTALAALAYAEGLPTSRERAGALDWLNAHRGPFGWNPGPANGPALAALAKSAGKGAAAADRYRLTITVNDTRVETLEVAGAATPKTLKVPADALKPGAPARIRFDLEGKGTFGYVATLAGFARDFAPDQDPANRPVLVTQRVYFAANPELDGKPLPTGFSAAVNAPYFENWVKQLPNGGRATVRIDLISNEPANLPTWKRSPTILRETLPAGASLVEGSIRTDASHHELTDGVLTFFFPPGQVPRYTFYEVFGTLPGDYRVLPAQAVAVDDPARRHLGQPATLTILPPGETSKDPYRATPDELYARGKALFNRGNLAAAAAPLDELADHFTLRDDAARDVARMLLESAIAAGNAPRKVVKSFEILKEKAPELVLPFDRIAAVGRAYQAIGESERAYLVWKAVSEASYLEDARIGEALRQRGRTLEGTAYLLNLWREYPDSAAIRADLFGLSRVVAGLATNAETDPNLRRQLTEANVTRPELQLQAIRLTQTFLACEPKGPMADEASLALVGDFLDLENYEAVVKLARRFATIYAKSTYLDSFQYAEALGRFHLAEYDRAIAVADAIARATYKSSDGTDQPSPNKWQALYILGQIHDARRQPAQALKYYQQVADRFTDAAGAVKGLERIALKLPEVSVIRPAQTPAVASGVSLRAVPAEDPGIKLVDANVPLDYRNIAEAEVTVYPVDLMRLYLARRTLDGIAGVDLAGISPLHQAKVKLGEGTDFDDKTKAIDLPLTKEGAYLVMARGGDRYTSGVVLVSPLELDVLEEPEAGRVRVTVRDARTHDPLPKVQVKVIGTDNPTFLSGQTDLRGVFLAEGVQGKVTAVARRAPAAYAFYRGTNYVGQPPQPNAPASPGQAAAPQKPAAQATGLEDNLRALNCANQLQQINRLDSRFNCTPADAPKGVQVKDAR